MSIKKKKIVGYFIVGIYYFCVCLWVGLKMTSLTFFCCDSVNVKSKKKL